MDEAALRHICRRLRIELDDRVSGTGWIDGACPLAPWTHALGTDGSHSFGVLVNPGGTSLFKCHACHHTGNMDRLASLLGQYRAEAVGGMKMEIMQAEMLGLLSGEASETAKPPPEPLDVAAYSNMFEPAAQHPTALAYLQGRNVSADTATALGIGYDPHSYDGKEDDGTDRFCQRVVFRVQDSRGLWGYTGRALQPDAKIKVKDYYGLPKRHILLGCDTLPQPLDHLWVVEGLFAFARAYQELQAIPGAGVVALLGSSLTEPKAEIIRALDVPTYLLLDMDLAGDVGLWGQVDTQTGAHKGGGAVDMLKAHVPTYVPEYVGGVDDPDDFTTAHYRRMLTETYLPCA